MLNKAIFRKHSKLFLYMISRTYFSQKEIILWSLNNNEFKDKDSWENKGQFRNKMIKLGVLKKYSYKTFKILITGKLFLFRHINIAIITNFILSFENKI